MVSQLPWSADENPIEQESVTFVIAVSLVAVSSQLRFSTRRFGISDSRAVTDSPRFKVAGPPSKHLTDISISRG